MFLRFLRFLLVLRFLQEAVRHKRGQIIDILVRHGAGLKYENEGDQLAEASPPPVEREII